MALKPTDYLMLPWTIRGPVRVTGHTGTVYEMRVAQLPTFLVTAPTESAALYAFKRALLAHLKDMIQRGEAIPAPSGPAVQYAVAGRQRRASATVNRARIHTAMPLAPSTVTM